MESLKISVDLKRRTNEVLSLQQGYTYPVELSVFDNGTAYTCTGATAQVHFLKSTGKFSIKTTDITISDNKVSFKLDNTLINRGGVGQLQVVLTKGGDVFGSWAIHCNVFANVIQDEATEDSNIIDVLGDLTKNIAKADPLTKALEKQIPQATPLTNSLKTQIPQATELVNEMKSAIEEGGTVDRRELGDFKKGYTGEEYADLNQRVNGDIDHVQQQINDSSLLPYEGTNIKADNTYYGLTKDMVVKGRTLQNLFTKSYDGKEVINNTNNSLYIGTSSLLKPSTTYTICYIIKSSNIINCSSLQSLFRIDIFYSDNMIVSPYGFVGTVNNQYQTVIAKFSTSSRSDISTVKINLRNAFTDYPLTENTLTVKDIIILEGDYTNTPIEELPFVEGIQSVGENEVQEGGSYLISGKSCGKNLLNPDNCVLGFFYMTPIDSNTDTKFPCALIKVKPNTEYVSNYTISELYFEGSTNGEDFIEITSTGKGIRTTAETNYIRVRTHKHLTQEGSLFKTLEEFYNNVIISEGNVVPTYEPYQESNYSYILNEPLMQLPNGVADRINLETGVLTRRVGKVVLDGREDWTKISWQTLDNTILFRLNSTEVKNELWGRITMISDRFIGLNPQDVWGTDIEGVGAGTDLGDGISIRILKSKLKTEDVAGFKTWLQANPTTVYYELAEPTTEQLEPTQLKSFEGTTHIMSNNTLQAHTSVKIPSNVQMVVQNLRAENKALNVELKDTKAELENTDLDILEMNWETDFRVCELEYAIYSQEARAVSLETNSRAISKYEQAKTLIEANRYNKTTMTRQLTVYLERGYITEEEYRELIAMME